jgi:hypothetical protein
MTDEEVVADQMQEGIVPCELVSAMDGVAVSERFDLWYEM